MQQTNKEKQITILEKQIIEYRSQILDKEKIIKINFNKLKKIQNYLDNIKYARNNAIDEYDEFFDIYTLLNNTNELELNNIIKDFKFDDLEFLHKHIIRLNNIIKHTENKIIYYKKNYDNSITAKTLIENLLIDTQNKLKDLL